MIFRAKTLAARSGALLLSFAALVGCGDDSSSETTEPTSPSAMSASAMNGEGESTDMAATPSAMGTSAMGGSAATNVEADDLARGLLVTYSPFGQNASGNWVEPQPARLEILTRHGGEWHMEAITDSDSNVFHKAMWFEPQNGPAGILTIGGMEAYVKLWTRGENGWTAETLWHEDFGGERNRMRDVEFLNQSDGTLAIATHDQGIVAVLRRGEDGWVATQSERRPNMFVHEIEIGDLDGDGTDEFYATPSEPNHMQGGGQSGEVVRYNPATMEPTVVANLGNRHAKEIWVGDADGDGRDELYVSVEGLTERSDSGLEVVEPVEIRRYDADTPPDQGVVIARIEGDHLMRFLTVGDVDGDGRSEMVAASFSRGLWLLRPGSNAREEWTKESIDRDSGGFEHASYLTDLDGDGSDELYVSSDNDGELRRYIWRDGRARRTVIHSRDTPRSMITWNIMDVPAASVRGE